MAVSEFGIGARLPRLEDERFLEGRGQFCADIALPGMMHAAFVRSPHAHARILSVRKPRDFAAQVYAAEDLTGVARMRSTAKLPGFKPSDWPILAAGKVRHAGEPIAMAIGSTPAEARLLAKGLNPEDGGAEIVQYDVPSGGSVFSVGSITWPASLLVDEFTSQITKNVLERAMDDRDQPYPSPAGKAMDRQATQRSIC